MIKPDLSITVEGKMPASLTEEDLKNIERAIVDNVLIKTEGKLGLKFVAQAESRRLNKQYADNDYATDVLSFKYSGKKSSNLGDIVVCTPIAEKQAKEFNVSLKSELTLLIVHGILHLLNYDHQSNQDTASMDWLQGAIMKSLSYEYRDFKWSH